MMGCNKCMKIGGVLLLVLGLLFLSVDLELFNGWNFFGIQWWTALFLLGGVIKLAMSKCPDCQAMRQPKKK